MLTPRQLDRGPTGLDDRLAHYASMARLAPSKHNAQPWRFRRRAGALEVWPDRSRLTPVTDPDGRELVLACGAAVHAATVAAAAVGMALEVLRWPDGSDGPVAVLRESGPVEPSAADAARLDALRRRRTDRGPLDATVLAPALPFDLQDAAQRHDCVLRLVRNEGERRTLTSVLDLADRQLARRPEVAQEVQAWTRRPSQLLDDGVPADATRGAGAGPADYPQGDFGLPGVPARHDRDAQDRPLVGVLCSPTDRAGDRLHAGEALMDVLLTATVGGAAASYLNQALEQQHTRDLLVSELDLPGAPQVVLRLGAGGVVPAVPRRPLTEVLEDP